MNHQIPLKFRAIAAGLQAIDTLSSASVVLIFSKFFFSSFFTDNKIFSIINDILSWFILPPIIFIIPSPIIIWILWRFTKSIHPFIDKSGKNAMNYALNSTLGLLFSALLFSFVFAATCGITVLSIGAKSPGLFEIGTKATVVCGVAFYCVALAYFISSAVAGIHAWNGSYFKSRFIYPFVR